MCSPARMKRTAEFIMSLVGYRECSVAAAVGVTLFLRSLCDLKMVHLITCVESSIVNRKSAAFKKELRNFLGFMVPVSLLNALLGYLVNELALCLRENASELLLKKYTSNSIFYRINAHAPKLRTYGTEIVRGLVSRGSGGDSSVTVVAGIDSINSSSYSTGDSRSAISSPSSLMADSASTSVATSMEMAGKRRGTEPNPRYRGVHRGRGEAVLPRTKPTVDVIIYSRRLWTAFGRKTHRGGDLYDSECSCS